MSYLCVRSHWEGTHLIWDGSVMQKGGIPLTHRPGTGSDTMTVRALIFQTLGIMRRKGWWLTVNCGNRLCVNPQHVVQKRPGEILMGVKKPRTPKSRIADAKRGLRMQKYPDEVAFRAYELRGKGMTYPEIEKEVGCTKSMVHYLIKRAVKLKTNTSTGTASVFNPAIVLSASPRPEPSSQPRTPCSAPHASAGSPCRSRQRAAPSLQTS